MFFALHKPELDDYEQENRADCLVEVNRRHTGNASYLKQLEQTSYFDMDAKVNSSEEIEYEKSFNCSNDDEVANKLNEEEDEENFEVARNAEEADDEQSDWYEHAAPPPPPATCSTDDTDKKRASFEAVPWWDCNEASYYLPNGQDSKAKKRSSYEKLNMLHRNLFNAADKNEEEKEFKSILSGALSLMNPDSAECYQAKCKDSAQKQQKTSNRKKRFNSFASDNAASCGNIATKSTANLNSLILEAQAGIVPVGEMNSGF